MSIVSNSLITNFLSDDSCSAVVLACKTFASKADAKSSEKTQTIAKTQTMALEEIVLSNNNFDVVD